jgi:hypothetical protein
MNLADQHNSSNNLQLEQFQIEYNNAEVFQKWLKGPNQEVSDFQVDSITCQIF